MPPIPVIDEFTWARIVAKAYLEPAFKNTLQRDPFTAVVQSRAEFSIPDPVRLMDLYYSTAYVSGVADSVTIFLSAIFQGSTDAVLSEIFTLGTLGGAPIELPCGEFIDPAGPTRLFQHSAAAISLKNWMRIYAYIWHQIRFRGNTTIEGDFEKDPAKTLKDPTGALTAQIIDNLNLAASPTVPKINYIYQTTPLFTLGDPPPGTTAQLAGIRGDPSAKNFRHRIRMCC